VSTFKVGDIFMARVPDPSGGSIDHDHPVIVASTKLDGHGRLRVVVISHKVTTPHPLGHIPMPWKVPTTGLWQPCVAKCDWIVPVNPEILTTKIGITPPATMDLIRAELIQRINAAKAAKPANP
jgi:mRNA-degrading endonuclease toxin of MazEF toxin-antitoxin module